MPLSLGLYSFFKCFYLFLRDRERRRCRESGGQRTLSGLCSDRSESNAGLELGNREVMT